ncbi:MAG: 2OG-Fe(II) oxygenase [Gammaproteobacteria bacterium]
MPEAESAAGSFVAGALLPRTGVRDETGKPTDLLSALEGQPSALIYLTRPHSPACRQVARKFATLELKVPRLVRALLLPQTTRGADAAALAALGLKVYVALEAGDIATDEHEVLYAVSDAAGRVLASGATRPNQIAQFGVRIRAAFAAPQARPDAPFERAAPVLILPDVLPARLCTRLIEHFDREGGHPSGVLDLSGPEPQWRPDPAVKRRRDLTLQDAGLIREIEQSVSTRVLPEISKCFHYVVSHHEPFKVVCYDEGSGYFRPHRDNETSDTLHRRFAMTVNLNTGDYEGGALQFPEFGPATYRPARGGSIVFSSSLLHEATDVVRGRRYVLLGFFYNPDDGLTPPEESH